MNEREQGILFLGIAFVIASVAAVAAMQWVSPGHETDASVVAGGVVGFVVLVAALWGLHGIARR